MRVTTSWWTLVALVVATYVGAWFTWGNEHTPSNTPVQYDGVTNLWHDADGRPIGWSATEDGVIHLFDR